MMVFFGKRWVGISFNCQHHPKPWSWSCNWRVLSILDNSVFTRFVSNLCFAYVNNFFFRTVFFAIFYVFRCHVFHLCVTFDSQRCVSTRSIAFRLALTALTAGSKSWWPRQRSWWSWRWSWLQLIDQNDQPMIMMLVMAQTNWSLECAARKWILISSCLTSWAMFCEHHARQMWLLTKTYDQNI